MADVVRMSMGGVEIVKATDDVVQCEMELPASHITGHSASARP